ncbi:MAG: Xaa-Pro dipeptidase [Frankiales bacterium]|nr:Xaa-Pro dipeptidase [Frankiales bacterium]
MLAGHVADVGGGPSPFQLPAAVLAPGDGPARLICSVDEAPEGDSVHTYEGFTTGPADPVSGARDAFHDALQAAGLQRATVLVDEATVPASFALALGQRATPAPGLGSLGAVKTESELAAIEACLRLCDAGQRAARDATEAGATELDIWANVTAAIEREAGQRLLIVADLVSGPRTADVGGPPTSRRPRDGELVICDLVPRLEGLWGDSCATWAIGEPPQWAGHLHGTCVDALRAGLDALRPGSVASEIDELVRSVVRSGGYEYPHHTGHGIGFRWHEEPRIIPGGEAVIEAGMVVALEPGGYRDGRGLRVEQVAVVTDNGARVLSRHSLEIATTGGS